MIYMWLSINALKNLLPPKVALPPRSTMSHHLGYRYDANNSTIHEWLSNTRVFSFLFGHALTQTMLGADWLRQVQEDSVCEEHTKFRHQHIIQLATGLCGVSICISLNFLLICSGPGCPETFKYFSKSFHWGSSAGIYYYFAYIPGSKFHSTLSLDAIIHLDHTTSWRTGVCGSSKLL